MPLFETTGVDIVIQGERVVLYYVTGQACHIVLRHGARASHCIVSQDEEVVLCDVTGRACRLL